MWPETEQVRDPHGRVQARPGELLHAEDPEGAPVPRGGPADSQGVDVERGRDRNRSAVT